MVNNAIPIQITTSSATATTASSDRGKGSKIQLLTFLSAAFMSAGALGSGAIEAQANTATPASAGRHCEAINKRIMICSAHSGGKSLAVGKGRVIHLRRSSPICNTTWLVPCPYRLQQRILLSPKWANRNFGNVIVMKRRGTMARAADFSSTIGGFWNRLKREVSADAASIQRGLDQGKTCLYGDASKASNIYTWSQSLPFANCGFSNEPVNVSNLLSNFNW